MQRGCYREDLFRMQCKLIGADCTFCNSDGCNGFWSGQKLASSSGQKQIGTTFKKIFESQMNVEPLLN